MPTWTPAIDGKQDRGQQGSKRQGKNPLSQRSLDFLKAAKPTRKEQDEDDQGAEVESYSAAWDGSPISCRTFILPTMFPKSDSLFLEGGS